ncbi:MAG: hypothetical protein AVDCRST_MAG89-5421, partial [uncultured Gemmatimonadetes bacterium]
EPGRYHGLRLSQRGGWFLRVPGGAGARHPAPPPAAGGAAPRLRHPVGDGVRLQREHGGGLPAGHPGHHGVAARGAGDGDAALRLLSLPAGHHHPREPRARHRALAPAALHARRADVDGAGRGQRADDDPRVRRGPAHRGDGDHLARLARRRAASPVVHVRRGGWIPGRDHHAGCAERERGGGRPPEALPAPHDGADRRAGGGERAADPRDVDARRCADLPAAAGARPDGAAV